MGCGRIHFILHSWSTLETDEDGEPVRSNKYYPPRLYRATPTWYNRLDKEWEVYQLLNEVYAALGSESYRLAVMGIRALLECLMISHVEDQGTFGKNLKEFEESGYISRIQKKSLLAVLEVGHAAIHRSHNPDKSQIDVCLNICENLIETIYVNKQDTDRLEGHVPKRKH